MSNVRYPESASPKLYLDRMTGPAVSERLDTAPYMLPDNSSYIARNGSVPRVKSEAPSPWKSSNNGNDTAAANAIRALQITVKSLTDERNKLRQENESFKGGVKYDDTRKIQLTTQEDYFKGKLRSEDSRKVWNEANNFLNDKLTYEDTRKTWSDAPINPQELLASTIPKASDEPTIASRENAYSIEGQYQKLRVEYERLLKELSKEKGNNEFLLEKLRSLQQDASDYRKIIDDNAKRMYEKGVSAGIEEVKQEYDALQKEYELYKDISTQKINELQRKLTLSEEGVSFGQSQKEEYLTRPLPKFSSPHIAPSQNRDDIATLEDDIMVLNKEYKDLLGKISSKWAGPEEKARLKRRLNNLSEIIQSRSEELVLLKEREQYLPSVLS